MYFQISKKDILLTVWELTETIISGRGVVWRATLLIRTRDLTSSERSSKEAKGAGPMRFWRRFGAVEVTPGDDMLYTTSRKHWQAICIYG